MRLLICAGGTAGGVNPALAVLETLKKVGMAMEVLWIGGEGGMEARLVERAHVRFKAIPSAGVHGVGLRQMPGNLVKVARGVAASRRILKEYKPDVLFFTGGYVAVPMALAGIKLPALLYVPDIEPGLALKTLSRLADRIAITSPESGQYFRHPERLALTGYPTRPGLVPWSKVEARRRFGLDPERPVLLVVGGSKGARSINRGVLGCLKALLEETQVLHISGELDWPEVEARAREMEHPGYKVHPYLHEEMGAALSAADLALSRAGASTLGEYPLFGLPSILVPYPYAWRYQKVNADHLVRQGAAVLLPDAQLAGDLFHTVKGLLQDPLRMESMRRAVKALARPQAAAEIGRLLVEMAGRKI